MVNTNSKAPIVVCVTGAAGQICYSLLPRIAAGEMFGKDQQVILNLLEIPPAKQAMEGVKMELTDCAYPLLQDIRCSIDPAESFKDADVAIFVGAFPRRKGMVRADLLKKNASIFESQGKVLEKVAKKTIKILVVGNPANTNCLILKENAPSIPKENFTCLTRLDMNRAKSQISLKTNTPIGNIKNIVIWGNHSKTQYPDVNQAFILSNGTKTPIRKVVNDDTYLNTDFITTVQQRGAAIIKARGLSSATSAAKAICDHIKDWFLGSDEIVSMGVVSDGSYNIKKGLIFSFPVKVSNGTYTIYQNIVLDKFSQEKIKATEDELINEQNIALNQSE